MEHPENVPQETRFLRQYDEIARLAIRMAKKVVREELGDPEEVGSDSVRAEYINCTVTLSQQILSNLSNLANLMRNAPPSEVDIIYNVMEKVVDAATKELKK